MAEDIFTPKPPRSLWPIFIGGLLMIGLFLAGSKLMLNLSGPAPDEDAARSLERRNAYADLQKENAEKLGGFAWADRAAQKVQIPIELAMRITAERFAADSPRSYSSPQPASAPLPTAAEVAPTPQSP